MSPEDENGLPDKDGYYEHLGAAVYSDRETAVLYNREGFCVYTLPDGTEQSDEPKDFEFPNADSVIGVYYLRNPQTARGEPETECLQVLRYDGSSTYYSPKDGSELATRKAGTGAAVSFTAGAFQVEQTSGGTIRIYENGSLKRELQEGTLAGASHTDEKLILTLWTSDWRSYSLMLDEKLRETARIPQPCDALPDGTLIFDDMQGHLFREKLLSLKDLRNRAMNCRELNRFRGKVPVDKMSSKMYQFPPQSVPGVSQGFVMDW